VTCTADIFYENKKSDLEQNIVLKTQPPSPAEYGMNPATTVIQAWSEFLNPAAPRVTRAATSQSGVTDQRLDFGAMKMGPGSAFLLGHAGKSRTHVFEEWINAENRTFLVEQIPLPKIAAQLRALPAPSTDSGMDAIPSTPTNTPSSALLRRPSPTQCLPPVQMARKSSKQIQVAAVSRTPASGLPD
jgi:hypothetical protein